ncbi:MAG: hypothetical protein IV090_00405 [Candidatus Sericytochromatia bacterium]|nr:hypothetical protein [Candidatus Sericytochromatia bacterium]
MSYRFCLILLLCALFCSPQGYAKEKNWKEIYTQFYPAEQIGLIHYPEYALVTSQLVWLPKQDKPNLFINYHRAVPFYDRGITLHFSVLLTHTPRSQVVKDNYRCQKDYKQESYRHPQIGDYVLCYQDHLSKAFPKAVNQTPMLHRTAFVYPRTGNRLPHISLQIAGFEADILPLLKSLHTLAR